MWSPDGRRLAFVYNTQPGFKRSGPRLNHLYIVAVDRNELKNVSVDPNALWAESGLAWSPDGRRLAFHDGRGIGMLDADLKWSLIPIATHESRRDQRPSWSPDGARLVWFSPDSIVISDPLGGQQQELTRGRCRGVDPSWSPDGQRIAFICSQDRSELFVMNADGSGLTKVTTLDADKSWRDRGTILRDPIWLPAIAR
jgi:Tol biopolymer transport system component